MYDLFNMLNVMDLLQRRKEVNFKKMESTHATDNKQYMLLT